MFLITKNQALFFPYSDYKNINILKFHCNYKTQQYTSEISVVFLKHVIFYNIHKERDLMDFKPKPTKKKVQAGYKTLYIKDELAEKINKIAVENETSFNNVVISILENFFENNE